MAALTVRGTVRDILSTDLELPADEVIKRARARGLNAPTQTIRYAVHDVRSELKKAKAAPAAARTTQPAQPTQPQAQPAHPAASTDLAGVLANVALVNKVVGVCGGVDGARQLAEAVRSCGGVDQFLQHLDLVASLRGPAAAG